MIEFQTLALILISLFFLIGLVGTLVPVIPGCVILWASIFVYKLVLPQSISWAFVFLSGGLTLLAQLLDYLCTYYGAKKFGGSMRGGVGALIGALLGPFVFAPLVPPIGSLMGLILGPVLGAFLGEISGGKNWKQSSKAGMGTVLGGMVSFILKFLIATVMVVLFYWNALAL